MFTSLEKTLSDHFPFNAAITLKPIKNALYILTWNMMNQMSVIHLPHRKLTYLNNGVGCAKEELKAYVTRLEIIAERIKKWVSVHQAKSPNNPIIIALQEGPLNKSEYKYFNHFITKLNSDLKFTSLNKKNNSLITFYDSSYTLSEDLTKSIQQTSLSEGFKDRVLLTVLLHTESQTLVLMVNVHADFKFPVLEDVISIVEKAKALHITEIIMSGDFNRNLTQVENDEAQNDINTGKTILSECGISASAIQRASFLTTLKNNAPITTAMVESVYLSPVEIETRDGVLTTGFSELTLMRSMNLVNPSHNQFKQLDNSLERIPHYFLMEQTEKVEQVEKKSDSFFSII